MTLSEFFSQLKSIDTHAKVASQKVMTSNELASSLTIFMYLFTTESNEIYWSLSLIGKHAHL